MLSMRVDTEHNPYVASISRGGLWLPHPWIVSIAEACEFFFKNNTDIEMITHLPVETIANQVLSFASVNGMWDNIVVNCGNEILKECKSLCLENFIKLYIKVRCLNVSQKKSLQNASLLHYLQLLMVLYPSKQQFVSTVCPVDIKPGPD